MAVTSLAGKTAVVTGAGSGIGRECARVLAEAGAHLILLGRTRESLLETQRILKSAGGSSEIRCCDVTHDEQVDRLFLNLPACDILVNNAGTNQPQNFLDVSAETLDRLLQLNVRAVFRVCQAAARLMIGQRSGSIVNMSSQMGHVGAARRVLYCMSKHAVEGLTKALAVELAPFTIRVNSVAPTYVETPLTVPFFENPDFRAEVLSNIPLGRLATVAEIGAAVLFLSSPGASMITGQSLRVDGGYTAK